MKLSELIKKLQDVQSKKGDLDCLISDERSSDVYDLEVAEYGDGLVYLETIELKVKGFTDNDA